MSKPRVVFRVLPDGRPGIAVGREAETLLALVAAGPKGLTSLEGFRAGWAVRLAAYVHDLRHCLGVPIDSIREEHDGGHHARYTLTSPVEILTRGTAIVAGTEGENDTAP